MADEARSRKGFEARRVVAFAAAVIVVLYYALRGGSYDIVVRHEEAIVVWWVVGLGYAVALMPRRGLPRHALIPLAAAAALALWTMLGLFWTSSDARTLAEVARVVHYAGLVLLIWSVLGSSTWRPAAAGLATATLVIPILALASRLWPGGFPDDDVARVFQTDRLNYPFDYWNSLAAWCAMAIAVALVWSAHARAWYTRMAFAAVIPACATAAYLTYSRQAVFGVALGVVAALVLSRNRWTLGLHALAAAAGSALGIAAVRARPEIADATGTAGAGGVALAVLVGAAIAAVAVAGTSLGRADDRLRLPKTAGRAAAATAALLASLAVVVLAGDRLQTAWDEFAGNVTPSAAPAEDDPAARLGTLSGSRYEQWQMALDAFGEHSVRGIGPGTYEFWWNREGGVEFVRDAHSLYLELLAEQGMPGFLLGVLFLVALFVLALRARARLPDAAGLGAAMAPLAAFAVYLFHAGVDWMWESTAISVLAIGGVAIAAIAARARLGPAASARRRPPRPAPALRAVVAVLALCVIALQLPGLASTHLLRQSQEQFAAGDLDAAVASAEDAIRAEPWAAGPRAQRGLISEAAGDLRVAARQLELAEEREPENWRYPLLRARMLARRGQSGAALASFRRALELRPETQFGRPLPDAP